MSKSELHENPLVPNQKLRQMYVRMSETRVLDEHIVSACSATNTRRKSISTRGEEACRVSTSIDLGPHDLVSDSEAGVVMDLLAGMPVASLLRRLEGKSAGESDKGSSRQLPWVKNTSDRLKLAMGAALSFRTLGHPHLVLAYVRRDDLGKGEWRRLLELAAKLDLPMFFVLLPSGLERNRARRKASISDLARTCGVPGLLVDAHDAVALYRVTQEILGRLRGGGGPVLIECVPCELNSTGSKSPIDPVLQMKDLLLERKIASKLWLEGAGDGLRRSILAIKPGDRNHADSGSRTRGKSH